jgi:F0F1-type ATP synthase assembly protein I
MQWASRIATIAAEMAAPPLLGYLLDQRLGTLAVFTAVGGILGLASGIWSLVRIANPRSDRGEQDQDRRGPGAT